MNVEKERVPQLWRPRTERSAGAVEVILGAVVLAHIGEDLRSPGLSRW